MGSENVTTGTISRSVYVAAGQDKLIVESLATGALGLKTPRSIPSRKTQNEGGWINGGFFVLSPRAIDAVTDDAQMFEREPIETLVTAGEVHAFFHHGFWQAMDTLRDKQHLEDLWSKNKAPWKTW